MDFALIGLPRSGTTWAANWLTEGGALCLHDPLAEYTPAELLALDPGRPWGIACTGAWAFPELLAALTCPVVIVGRDLRAVAASLASAGLPPLPECLLPRFRAAKGTRVPFSDLWTEEGAANIWRTLRPGRPFDAARYRLLRGWRVETIQERVTMRPESVAALRAVMP